MNRQLTMPGGVTGPNYARIAKLWSEIIGRPVTAQQVALCLSQMHISFLIDNPWDAARPMDIATSIFAYEALQFANDTD